MHKPTLIALFVAALSGLLVATPGTAHAALATLHGKVTATPSKYLAETVVYVDQVPGKYAPHLAVVDQLEMRFVPHIVVITAGDTVEFQNHDHVTHNVFSPDGGFNLGAWGYGESRRHTFAKRGVYTLLCGFHPEMLAYAFVGQNPYASVVGADGSFTIGKLPPGTYTVQVWNSHLKAPAQRVTVRAGTTAEVSFALRR